MLEPLDLGEVDAVEEDPGRVQTAQALSDDPIDRLVVRDRRPPAHSSQEADRLHRVSALAGHAVIPPESAVAEIDPRTEVTAAQDPSRGAERRRRPWSPSALPGRTRCRP